MRFLLRVLALALFTSVPLLRLHGAEGLAPFERTESPYFKVRGGDADDVDALPLKDTQVDVTIAGVIAEVAITQTYENLGSRALDATYVFPGSTRAAVHGLTMMVGDRVVQAQIQTKPQARRTFEQAKSEGRTASLLEEHRPNVFQMSLANILPGDVVHVQLRYTELLLATDSEYEFVFPAVVGPHYSADPQADALARAMRGDMVEPPAAPTWALKVDLAAGVPLVDVACATHPVKVTRPRPDRATITVTPVATADRDFILRFRLAGDAVQTGLLVSGKGTDDAPGYFLAMVQPPARPDAAMVPPRDYVFVVDVSGSMHGFPLETAKTLLRDLISELRAEDTFNVVTFESGVGWWSFQPMAATPENLADAIVTLERKQGGGGTNLLAALEQVQSLPRRESLSRTVVVVTDGFVSVEAEAFDRIRRHLDRANVFAFGIGGSVNRHLIECLARAGSGEPFIVTKPEEAPAVAARFHRYIANPVLTKVGVKMEGFRLAHLSTEALPDVFAQRPVILSGQWVGEGDGRITISGVNANGPFSATLALADAVRFDNSRVLELLWARQQIAVFADKEACDPGPEHAAAITRLGLEHGLLTKYTSFVAVDHVVRHPTGSADLVMQRSLKPAGLNANAAGEPVPATPEPATLGMLAIVAFALVFALLMQRRRRLEVSAPRDVT